MRFNYKNGYFIVPLLVLLMLSSSIYSQFCNCSGFNTYTQGGWSSTPNGNNPGTILQNNFEAAFPAPNYLTIGCNNKLRLTSASAVRNYLPQVSSPSALPTGTLTNPNRGQHRNVFAGQLVALAINIRLDNMLPAFGANPLTLASLRIAYGPFAGLTVQQFFDMANQKIGGCTPAINASFSAYSNAADMINNNYNNGNVGNYLACPLTASCTSVNACFGVNNGTVTASTCGGALPFSYNWGGAAGNVATATGLAPGTYTVIITDAIGQTATTTCTVGEHPELFASDSHTDVSCWGGNNGTVTVNFSGGGGGFEISVNGGPYAAATSPKVFTGLTAGTYNWVVRDANGCTISGSETVNQPTALVANDSHTDVSCFGGSNGSVTITYSGGTAPYQVSFNGGAFASATSPKVYSNLSAGSYSWTVRDANGCEASGSETVNQPTALVASDSHTNVLCYGGSTGSVTITFSGGTTPYQVSFSGGAFASATSPKVYSSLSPGSYSWTVRDANGCEVSGSETVTEPTVLVASDSHTDVSCFGGSNGSV
ncbi:MAG: SprB repeat-containing protein, partial [Flavobacteriales bacterium]